MMSQPGIVTIVVSLWEFRNLFGMLKVVIVALLPIINLEVVHIGSKIGNSQVLFLR